MLQGGYSWRLFFYVCIAFSAALFVVAFFFAEESAYKRAPPTGPTSPASDEKLQEQEPHQTEAAEPDIRYSRKSYLSTLKPWSAIDHDIPFFMTMARSFTYYFVPAVFWVITTYGE